LETNPNPRKLTRYTLAKAFEWGNESRNMNEEQIKINNEALRIEEEDDNEHKRKI
jgi:hypothetical protein